MYDVAPVASAVLPTGPAPGRFDRLHRATEGR
jgi:hypothetical protein